VKPASLERGRVMSFFERMGRSIAAVLLFSTTIISNADSPPKPPTWQVTESVVPLTGAASVVAVLPSSNTVLNMIGQPEAAGFVLRCQDRVLVAYVAWPQVLQVSGTAWGGGAQAMVLWKFDQGSIAANFWDRSDGGTAAGKFTTKGATKLVGQLYPAHQMVVRLTGTSTQDAIFELGDFQAVATKVGAACGVSWNYKK